MGWCAEFGVEISACDHPMVAGAGACTCEICGTRCEGRFDGCSEVWAKGPVQVGLVRRAAPRGSGHGSRSAGAPKPRPGDEGMTDVRASLRRLEARLNVLEMNVTRLLDMLVDLDGSSNGRTATSGAGGHRHHRGNDDG